ncbi:MAG: DUF4365 domain-containing protein [Gemmataceae bacterium]|nr:DUF4365 domain-containing protein [Gemmataceae bacterium]
MAKRPLATPRKRRTREHVIADLSVNHVERQALLCGFSVERVRHDYGLDLILSTYNKRGEVESGEIFLQLKATNRVQLVGKGQFVAYRLERTDLHAWLRQFLPVVLVVYDAPADRAYWLYVQAYFEKQPGFDLKRAGETVTVRIPTSNVLDPDAIRTFARYRDRVGAQLEGKVIHAE